MGGGGIKKSVLDILVYLVNEICPVVDCRVESSADSLIGPARSNGRHYLLDSRPSLILNQNPFFGLCLVVSSLFVTYEHASMHLVPRTAQEAASCMMYDA